MCRSPVNWLTRHDALVTRRITTYGADVRQGSGTIGVRRRDRRSEDDSSSSMDLEGLGRELSGRRVYFNPSVETQVSGGSQASSAFRFRKLGSLVENVQIAVIREQPMALFARRLTNHPELNHVLQGPL